MHAPRHRPGALTATLGPLAVWAFFALARPVHGPGWVFLILATAAGVAAFVVAPRATRTDRVVAFAGSTLATLATVIGIAINFVVLLASDACPGTPNQVDMPTSATVAEFTVIPLVYLLTSWLLLRHGRSPLWLPLATIAAWSAISLAYVVLAAAGYPHHCYT